MQTITRAGQPSVTHDPVHRALQVELFKLLVARFGKENVELEANYVDITVLDGARKKLIEIKSDADARCAIRQALGQLLEYAYFNPDAMNENAELFVLAPGDTTASVSNHVAKLRSKFRLPVTYCTFSLGDGVPKELD